MKQFKADKCVVQTIKLSIGGMTCAACVRHVIKALDEVTGVVHVDVDLQKSEATVEHLPDAVDLGSLVAAVQDAGYQARIREWGTEAGEAVARSAAGGCSTGCCCEH